MLITIVGNLGSGKTLLAVILGYYSKKKVVSNFSIHFKHKKVERFDLATFLQAKYESCTILLDEAYTYLESRVSGNQLNRIMSYILFQSRKKNVELYITAQLLSSIDLRYRELSELYVVAYRNGIDFKYYFVGKGYCYERDFEFDKVIPFLGMYDTNEVILTKDKKMLFEIQSSDEKVEELKEYARVIEKHYSEKNINKITKNLVSLYATSYNMPKFLINDVYTIIRMNAIKKKKQKR